MKSPMKLTAVFTACMLMATGALVYSTIHSKAWAVEKFQASPGKFRCSALQVTTAAPLTVLLGSAERNAWVIQNLGPNAIYCNGDSTVTVSTSNSLQVPANGGVLTSDMFGGPNSATDTIKCIAASADQVSPTDTRKCTVW